MCSGHPTALGRVADQCSRAPVEGPAEADPGACSGAPVEDPEEADPGAGSTHGAGPGGEVPPP
eukprot:6427192-Heterocapsa_arctica.AAC.1